MNSPPRHPRTPPDRAPQRRAPLLRHSPWLLLGLLLTRAAHAAFPDNEALPEIVAVLVGANNGASADEQLQYAEKDAFRVRDALIELSGLRPERALVIRGSGRGEVFRALAESKGRVAEIAANHRRVFFLFYYSGHGDDTSLHLPRGAIDRARLRQAIASVGADFQLSIFDACRTSGRQKGVTRGAVFPLAVAPDAPSGHVEINSAAVGEPAQESSELGGSVFTHFVVSGLRGDADSDHDGQVTLFELYSYAYHRTLERTAKGALPQHADLRVEDLKGAGSVVLSVPAKAAARLEVPRGADQYLVFAQPSGNVLTQFGGADPRPIALPAGRFLVVQRASDRVSVATVDLVDGGQRRLSARDFRRVSPEQVAVRGGHLQPNPFRLQPTVGVGIEYPRNSVAVTTARAGFQAVYSRGPVDFELGVGYVGGAGQLNSTLRNRNEHSIQGGPSLSVRLLVSHVVLAAAAGLELRYTWYRFTENAGSPLFRFGSLGPYGGLRLHVPLRDRLSLAAFIHGGALFNRYQPGPNESPPPSGVAVRPWVSFTAALGYAF